MRRFVEGEDRLQMALLPHCLDDYVTENNPVRVIEAFIDELDLGRLGFDGVVPETTGRPAYHPATLLKIYLYGYLNRIPSSRRLERETQRSIELMWLTGRLMPDFKTIADFRKDNGPAIRAANPVSCRVELDTGATQANAKIAESMFAMAIKARYDTRFQGGSRLIAGLRRDEYIVGDVA